MNFNYENAFSRNIGWVTKEEQEKIKKTVIAIPGVGGVGGHHAHCLVRMGFQNFKIADLDIFEEHNFNRQIGAKISSLNKSKVLETRDMLLDINPNCNITTFENGVNKDNYYEFLKDVDLLVDGLDLYVFDVRLELFEIANELKIPIITAGPFGMGTSILAFKPGGMSFQEYFRINKNMSKLDKLSRFLAGFTPKLLQMGYLVSKDKLDVLGGKVPSIHTGCTAATSAIGSYAVKITLNRGKVLWAPRGFHVDFYRMKSRKFWRPFGNINPLQKILIRIFKNQIQKLSKT